MDLRGIATTLRNAISLVDKAKQAELVTQLLDVQQSLLDAYDESLRQREEVQRLKARIAELEGAIARRDELVFWQGLYHPANQRNEHGEPNAPRIAPLLGGRSKASARHMVARFPRLFMC